MNLYRILAGHISPKDSMMAISHYVVANDDTEVYEMIREMYYLPKDDDEYIENKTDDVDEIAEIREDLRNEDGYHYGPARIIREKGNTEDDSEYEDAYYGGQVVKWEVVKEDITDEEIDLLTQLGIFEEEEIVKNRLLGISYC